MAQKLYLKLYQKYETFYGWILKRIVAPTLFKKKTCEWAPKNWPRRLCKTYVQNVGFL